MPREYEDTKVENDSYQVITIFDKPTSIKCEKVSKKYKKGEESTISNAVNYDGYIPGSKRCRPKYLTIDGLLAHSFKMIFSENYSSIEDGSFSFRKSRGQRPIVKRYGLG